MRGLPPLVAIILAFVAASSGRAQTTGRIMGRAVEAGTGVPVATADILVEDTDLRTQTNQQGDFILTVVPTGEHRLRVERIGFRTVVVAVRVRAGRATQVRVELPPAPVAVEGIAAEVERAGLIEPDVIVTHEVVLGRELRALPVDEVEEVVELTTGVSDGHFRGGRVGQEVYKIDGLVVKNQLEAARQGPSLELSPTALEEIEVVTGGLGVDAGSALSGAVSYVTRKGNAERFEARVSLSSDHWLPNQISTGFSQLSLSLGGPIRLIGPGSVIFADLLAQGMIDTDPRARGLTCLRPEDADPELADAIEALASDPATAHLYCPFTNARIPFQRGDKLIGFLRIDRPLSRTANLTLSLLHNRKQAELFTPEFKYNRTYQLGQRSKGYLAILTLDWMRHAQAIAYRITARGAAMRLDRHLGVLDPWTFEGRYRLAGFGPSDFRFLGEDFVRSPIERQLSSGMAVPGYSAPGGSTGSPFGPAAEGIFSTEGTPQIATWSRSEFIGGDLVGEVLSTRGHALRLGASSRFYRVESYERVLASLPGSAPDYARFFPATLSGYAELSLLAAHDITVQLGLRVEAFRSNFNFQPDRADVFAPAITTDWKTSLMPRFGMGIPLPGTGGRTMLRLSYALVAQAPDFAFFLDSTIGDSLRTDIRRQGNPNLGFESGNAWEIGLTHLATKQLALGATFFRKELQNLVTSSLSFTGFAENQFTTGDFGSVKGLELSMEARWPALRLRAGYALLDARGVTSSAFEDPGGAIKQRRLEFPLAFDRRHSADFVALFGRAAGAERHKWGLTVTGSIRSGFPLRRAVEPGDPDPEFAARLPWTYVFDLRAAREFGTLPGCERCAWRLFADVRNLSGTDNIIAQRRDTGSIAPPAAGLSAIADQVAPDMQPIPRESPAYSRLVDLNGDGLIVAQEMRTARFAAALDRHDPSLYFGESRRLRLGLEISF